MKRDLVFVNLGFLFVCLFGSRCRGIDSFCSVSDILQMHSILSSSLEVRVIPLKTQNPETINSLQMWAACFLEEFNF